MIYKKRKKKRKKNIIIISPSLKSRSSAKPFLLFILFLFVFQQQTFVLCLQSFFQASARQLESPPILVLLRLSAFCRLHHRRKKIKKKIREKEKRSNPQQIKLG
jgi:fatty acid desaturase